jgi:hypothetical protein
MSSFLIVESDHQDSVHDGYAEQRNKSDRGRNAEVKARDPKREDAADNRVGNARECENGIAKIVEEAIKGPGDQDEANGYDDFETLFRFL